MSALEFKCALVLLLASLAALSATSCVSAKQRFVREFTPGQLKEGARIHAFVEAGTAFGVLQGHMVSWEARLEGVEDDLPGFFAAIEKSGYRAEFEVVNHPATAGGAAYEYQGTPLTLIPRGRGERFVLPGEQGTLTTVYVAALLPASKQTGVPPEVLRRGHFAFFKLATMTTQLNALDDSLRKHAFGLLVLREKLNRGESNVDALSPMRPREESLDDIEVALRVIAEHHAATSKLRGEVLAILALARAYEVPEARAALAEQMAESRAAAAAWRATHRRPTQADFGVAMKELKLPTPENMLAVLDKDGYIAAAVKVASSVATGDVAGTVEGFGKFAPPDSSLRIASEGAAAALRGDVVGTAKAVLALAQKQEDVADIAARLRSVEAAVASARSTVDGAASSVESAKKGVDTARRGGKPR
jgi:hypothetical protein